MGIVIKNTITYIKVKLLVNNVFSLRKTISQKTSSKKTKGASRVTQIPMLYRERISQYLTG